MAEWRVYGCGSASSNRSLQTSFEFVDGNTRLQIDLGNGAIYQRCRYEGSINAVLDAVSHIFVTHGHHDHTVDFARHIVAWKYTPGYSPGKPVHLYFTEETKQEIQNLVDSSGFKGIFEEIYVPHIIQPNKTFTINDVEITPYQVEHMNGSLGFNLKTKDGLHISHTSDTKYFAELSKNFHDVDLLVTESCFFDDVHPMHLNLKETSTVAAEAHAKNILITHFYPEMEAKTDEEIRQAASQWYGGNVFCGQDGLALEWNAQTQSWQSKLLFLFNCVT
jgi:ribonuclease BN (tRNA processing enzyme)